LEIAILGTGAVGRALSSGWVDAGHRVTLGSRHPDRPRSPLAAPVTDLATAAASAPIVVYAAPWSAASELLEQIGSLNGQLLIDCTNPLLPRLEALDPGAKPSAAEWFAGRLPEARVVKAFNTVSAATLASPRYATLPATQFFCGDDLDDKRQVAQLIADLGLEPIDVGRLSIAHCLESLALLTIHLAVHHGQGDCVLKLLRRAAGAPIQ
jgi:predicted dinucleotide-binding enzyme